MINKIDNFSGEYRFLSNFHPAEVEYEGEKYPTTEHAFQAAKTLDLSERNQIRKAPTPGIAKRLGRQCSLRPDWEPMKIDVMRSLIKQKFLNNPELKQKSIDTGDSVLIEGNTWNDTFWGVCKGKGKNVLGQLLVEVREDLRCKSQTSQ